MGPSPREETPEGMLDQFRAHPEWDDRERDSHLGRLVGRFPADRVLAALRPRLRDLGAADGEALLRLVDAFATPELLAELARALETQPGLAPERAWEALELLDGAGMLDDYPGLAERRAELDDLFDEDGALDELAEQLEGDPDGGWLALQGLGAVERAVRPQIVAGLASAPVGPGLVEFLRVLCFAHDPATRAAALDALDRPGDDDPLLLDAWAALAAEHPDPAVVARARRRLGGKDMPTTASARPGPVLDRALVTALDGSGQGSVVLSARRPGRRASAAFLCDVGLGIRDVLGQVGDESDDPGEALRELAEADGRELLDGAPALALGLLAGSLTLCGPTAPPALRFWLEATAPAHFQARPLAPPYPDWDPAALPFDAVAAGARLVLDACPTWRDESPLTYELAEELALRHGGAGPDPRRDAGAYRFLFEHRLAGELERYGRMLLWMASFWQGAGRDDLGRPALALAWQLADAQHAVPGHPFTVLLSTRSLAAALGHLQQGIDPRRRPPA